MVRGHLDLLLLAVLSGGPRHGYAVISELKARSEGEFDLPEGTVYPALHKLEQAGLIASEWNTVDGRRRRLYALTAVGSTALVDQRDEWRRYADSVTAVLA
jgi:PadR family transcriptional regulator, regulatory protein PadR